MYRVCHWRCEICTQCGHRVFIYVAAWSLIYIPYIQCYKLHYIRISLMIQDFHQMCTRCARVMRHWNIQCAHCVYPLHIVHKHYIVLLYWWCSSLQVLNNCVHWTPSDIQDRRVHYSKIYNPRDYIIASCDFLIKLI